MALMVRGQTVLQISCGWFCSHYEWPASLLYSLEVHGGFA